MTVMIKVLTSGTGMLCYHRLEDRLHTWPEKHGQA